MVIALAAFLLLAQATGTVTDSVTHQPIRGAHVKTADSEDVVTGEDGGYSIAHPGKGDVQFWMAAKGYRSLGDESPDCRGRFCEARCRASSDGQDQGQGGG